MNIFTVTLLPARHGDAIWIEYGDPSAPHRILIDGGATVATRATIARLIRDRADPTAEVDFELVVLTHIDADHLAGLLALFEDEKIPIRARDVWFNGWKHLPDDTLGAKQAERLTAAIERRRLPWNMAFKGEAVGLPGGPGTASTLLPCIELEGGMNLTLLSPTYDGLAALKPVWKKELQDAGLTPGSRTRVTEQDDRLGARQLPDDLGDLAHEPTDDDDSKANGASIAFLAEYGGRSILLTGDAHASVLEASIRRLIAQRGGTRLTVDAVKLPHHGSKYNLSPALLALLDTHRFLISTDGTSRSRHPDPVALSRIVTTVKPASLEFNYRSETTETWERRQLQRKYGYSVVYPTDPAAGLTVTLEPVSP